MQQGLMNERSPEFWAAVNGTFTVRDATTGVEYGKDADIPDGTRIAISWRYEPAGGGPAIEGAVKIDRHGPVVFHNGASLVAELFTMAAGTVFQAEWKFANGNWMYLLGEPDWFWSAVINRRRSGRICPAPGEGKTFRKDTVWGRVYKQMFEGTREEKFLATLGGSHSLASIALQHSAPQDLVPFFEKDVDKDRLPATDSDLPAWWLEAERVWTEQLDRCIATGKAPCMFCHTEAGCAASNLPGGNCPYLHDDTWLKEITAWKQAAALRSPSAASKAPVLKTFTY
jgi:hypothetical protein